MSRTGIGLAVRKGAPHPDVSTPDALKNTLLAAKSIGQTALTGGGITALHVQRVFQRSASPSRCPKAEVRGGRTERPRQRAGGERRSRDRVAAGLRADVESRCRGDRHAAGQAAADHHQCRGHHHRREGARRRPRADPASDDAGGAGDLQDEGVGTSGPAVLDIRVLHRNRAPAAVELAHHRTPTPSRATALPSSSTSPDTRNRECTIATSGARMRTCISSVSRWLVRNGPPAPCNRCISFRNSARVLIHTPLTVTNCPSSVSDSTMPSGSCRSRPR